MTKLLGAGFLIRNIHNGKFAILTAGRGIFEPPRLNFTRNIDAAMIFSENSPSAFAKSHGINVSSLRDCEFVAATAHRHVSINIGQNAFDSVVT